MICPFAAFRMAGRTWRVKRKAPVRFVSTTRCQSATDVSEKFRWKVFVPALLTSTSTAETLDHGRDDAFGAFVVGDVPRERQDLRPVARTREAVSSSLSLLRATKPSVAPSPAIPIEMARPIPVLAPVTMITLPCRDPMARLLGHMTGPAASPSAILDTVGPRTVAVYQEPGCVGRSLVSLVARRSRFR